MLLVFFIFSFHFVFSLWWSSWDYSNEVYNFTKHEKKGVGEREPKKILHSDISCARVHIIYAMWRDLNFLKKILQLQVFGFLHTFIFPSVKPHIICVNFFQQHFNSSSLKTERDDNHKKWKINQQKVESAAIVIIIFHIISYFFVGQITQTQSCEHFFGEN